MCLLEDNAHSHVVRLTSRPVRPGHFDPFSPDLTPRDCHLFLHVTKIFDDDDEAAKEGSGLLAKGTGNGVEHRLLVRSNLVKTKHTKNGFSILINLEGRGSLSFADKPRA